MSQTIQNGVNSRVNADSSEIRPLTSLRMIAALLVFLEHFIGPNYWTLGANFWEAVAIEGHIGVTIFFVLSGFLLTLRYYDLARDGRLSLFDYFTKRAARIYPLYYFLLILVIFLTHRPLFSLTSAANFTLTQGFFQHLTIVVPTSWSLTTEECFYLLLPLFILTIGRLRIARDATPARELIGLLIVLCCWTAALGLIGLALVRGSQILGLTSYGGFMSDLHHAIYTTIFFRFPNFAVGIFFARFYQRVLLPWWKSDSRQRIVWVVYATLLISTVSIAILAYLMNRAGGVYSHGWVYNYPVALFSGTLILGLAYPNTIVARILSHPLPVYLGRISYALYLVQLTLVAQFAIALFRATTLVSQYVVLTVISALLYELVEKQGSGIVKRLTRRIKGGQQTIASVQTGEKLT